jgi:hypothetical protein
MAVPKNAKRKPYVRYADHRLTMAALAKAQVARPAQREIAAECPGLADTVLHSQEPPK